MRKRIVIALGGNALGNSPEEQLRLVQDTAKVIVDLVDNYDVVVTHGNGPQVGMINMAMEVSHDEVGTPTVGFAECGAMSQGYIGYHLQQSIQAELKARNIDKRCSTVLTQVVVDQNDSAFTNPTKPIGSFYTKEDADRLAQERGYIFKEDAGRGYRRVVASPAPKEIVEIDTIQLLLENNNIVIAGGGGGIPVTRYNHKLKGVDAVIDKDKTSAQLAIDIKADIFLILTAVEKVCINYNKENEKKLDFLMPELAKQYIDAGEFKPGSMLPKIEACLKFVEYDNKATALITSLGKAKEALEGKTGTVIK